MTSLYTEQYAKKAARRKAVALLPIEEKLRRLIKLQARTYATAIRNGRKARRPWKSDGQALSSAS